MREDGKVGLTTLGASLNPIQTLKRWSLNLRTVDESEEGNLKKEIGNGTH